MKLHHPSAEIYVPDGVPFPEAIGRVTHLGVGAHHDDLEFMAFHGILACYKTDTQWFGGVTCTDGSGSVRSGPYENLTRRAVENLEEERAKRSGGAGAIRRDVSTRPP